MKLIIDISEEDYKEIKHNKQIIESENISNTNGIKAQRAIINGTPIPDNAAPCDFCKYNPPSSTDGKPCCMCPATPYQKGGKK